ncbi:putative bifunctional diguanylate cyclase/phosphodiesterase [Ideonella sp.]|uniref:putative bifunctional diguanylate cyclase/phosphodiesterase n=1 Tax=Ideonella sp. TaxID=1929293 RepID=UPI0035B352FE
MPATTTAAADPAAGSPRAAHAHVGATPTWLDPPRPSAQPPRGRSSARRWHWPHMSIRMTVLAAILAGVVLPGLGMLWADARTARVQIDPLIDRRREHLLSLTAIAVAEPWHRGQLAELAVLQAAALRDPLVCGVELRSTDGAGAAPAGSCAGKAGVTWSEQPIIAGGQLLGTLRMGFDTRVRDQLLSDRQGALMRLVAAQVVLGALVLLWVLNWRLLRPIDRLKRQAGAMAQPDARAAPRVDWLRQDELGVLGQHLNLAHDRLDSLLAELESSNAELRRLAMVDQLTGLPNRRLFRELFDHALAVAKRSQQTMALMFIDLDRFKHINDTLGHPAGDELLRTLGQRLRQVMRGSDIIGRLSGDEFLALLPDVKGPEAIAHTALRVIHAIEGPVPLAGKAAVQMQVSASVGVALFPADGGGFDELLRHADQAMYRAKAAGRGRYVLFREVQRPDTPKPGSDAELAMALTRHELLLHYQPVIDTHTGRAVGAEALLRWQHPSQGLLPPARFFHRAEECGQIHALEQLALRSACEQLAQWKAAGVQAGHMAVNLSAGEFRHEQLPRLLARALQEHHLGAGELELELSSHSVMSDPEFTQARVEELRALGVSLVLEDVGSSMLSLSRLGQLHPARIKIDSALVSRLPEDLEACATVHAIVQLARSLGVGVAASGVETEAQRDALTRAGCHWQQGFFFARPGPASNEPQWAAHTSPGRPVAATVLAPSTFDQRVLRPAANASSRSRPH